MIYITNFHEEINIYIFMRTFIQYLIDESPDYSKGMNSNTLRYADQDSRTFFIINHEHIIGSTKPTTHYTMIDNIKRGEIENIKSNKKLDKELVITGRRRIEGRIWLNNYVIAFWNQEKDLQESDIKLIFDFYNIPESDRKQFRLDIESYDNNYNFKNFVLAHDLKKQKTESKTKQKSPERINLEKQLLDAQRSYHMQTGVVKRYTAILIKKIQDKILSLPS